MTKMEMDIKKKVLLRDYENTVHAMLQNKKVLELPDFMVEDLKKLRDATEEIQRLEKLEN